MGLECMKVPYTDFELQTTPQLHFLVANADKGLQPQDYIEHFTNAYVEFISLLDEPKKGKNKYERHLTLDCSNGVGAIPMQSVAERLKDHIHIDLINTRLDTPTKLNEGCGAEFVHKENKIPSEVTQNTPTKCAAFDGDADRLMYFRPAG